MIVIAMPPDVVPEKPQREWRKLWVILVCWGALVAITLLEARTQVTSLVSSPAHFHEATVAVS